MKEKSPARRAAGVTPAPSVKVKNAKLRAARYFALRDGASLEPEERKHVHQKDRDRTLQRDVFQAVRGGCRFD
jgi:hypothetical protein